MWLVVTGLAAVVVTALWYASAPADRYKLGFLSLIYCGATLMWLVDHVLVYVEEGGPFLQVDADGTALGLSVILLGLVIWLVRLLVADPKGVLRAVGKK